MFLPSAKQVKILPYPYSVYNPRGRVRSHFDRQCISKTHWTCLLGQPKASLLILSHTYTPEKAPNLRRFSHLHHFIFDIKTTHSTCLGSLILMSKRLYLPHTRGLRVEFGCQCSYSSTFQSARILFSESKDTPIL